MRRQQRSCASLVLALAGGCAAWAQGLQLTVDATRPGAAISPLLHGIFFEELNHAGEGGLYAEMVQNRTFEEQTTAGWSLRAHPGATGRMSLDTSQPLNAANHTALRVDVAGTGEVAVINEGWWGMGFRKGETYRLSLYARTSTGSGGSLEARLESASGQVHASGGITGLTSAWKRFTVTLVSDATDRSGRLSLAASAPGTFWLDVVSLFPADTWKNRPNGMRMDLAQLLADLQPAFMRFPGGCFVEGGDYLRNAFRWKTALGDIADRPGHLNATWHYWSTDGLGLHEYLQLAEDLGAEPLFVPDYGVAHKEAASMDQMGELVQDALDAIEYANGPVTSRWGAVRAKSGHPAPFHLKYVEIGNDIRNQNYIDRYPILYKAIKARYPDLQLIAATEIEGTPIDIMDRHLYGTPLRMRVGARRYDDYDRKAPKVFEGEWATNRGVGKGNLKGALAEAAYMVGFERNAEVMAMASYAPLLYHVEDRHWPVNLIGFDSSRSFGTPSYWVQWLFAHNRGDVVLPSKLECPSEHIKATINKGGIGLATSASQTEFKDIQVTGGGQVLFSSDFSREPEEWHPNRGNWHIQNGAYAQLSPNVERDGPGRLADFRSFAGSPEWTDYTVSLKTRRIGGSGGFAVIVRAMDNGSWFACHVDGSGGAWVERSYEVISTRLASSSMSPLETGRWYDVAVEVRGPRLQCSLDGKPVVAVDDAYSEIAVPLMEAVANREEKTGEILLKIVNFSAQPQKAAIKLEGAGNIASEGTETVLSSASPEDENSLDEPKQVAPVTRQIGGLGNRFDYTLAANSVTVIRLKPVH